MEEAPTPGQPPAPEGTAPPDSSRRDRRRRKGLLAHLPPVPKPIEIDVPGLSPKKAFIGWLLLVVVLLAGGIGLNYVLTEGEWVPPGHDLLDQNSPVGETSVQFFTTHPYDLLTATLFLVSVGLLAVSLISRRKDPKDPGVFTPLALGAVGVAVALSLLALIGTHLETLLPLLATMATHPLTLPAAIAAAAAAVAFALIGRFRAPIAAKRHEIRALGWTVFAAHWALTGMYYFVIENGDWVNMIFAYAAVLLLAYFAYQELVSRTLGEDNPSLRFAAGAVVVAAGVWYAFLRIEPLSQIIIETVATHTVWMLELFNQNVTINEEGRTGFLSAISYPDAVYARIVIIVLACTAIQSMMIFVAAAVAAKDTELGRMKVFEGMGGTRGTKTAAFLVPSLVLLGLLFWAVAPLALSLAGTLVSTAFMALPVIALWGVWVAAKPLSLNQRRLLAIAVTVPVVYVLNLARNTGIIIMWANRWLEVNMAGLVSTYASFTSADASGAAFSLAHNWVGKGGSLLALVAIAFIVFKILPEVLRALVGLLDLPRRRGPLEQYWRTLRGHKDETVPANAPEPAWTSSSK